MFCIPILFDRLVLSKSWIEEFRSNRLLIDSEKTPIVSPIGDRAVALFDPLFSLSQIWAAWGGNNCTTQRY